MFQEYYIVGESKTILEKYLRIKERNFEYIFRRKEDDLELIFQKGRIFQDWRTRVGENILGLKKEGWKNIPGLRRRVGEIFQDWKGRVERNILGCSSENGGFGEISRI